MTARSVLLIVLLALTFASAESATAALAPRTETGPAQGVQATVTGTTVEVRFTGTSASWGTARAGKRVTLICEAHPAPGLLFADNAERSADLEDHLAEATVAADGTSLRATLKKPGDACDILFADRKRPLDIGRARAALTPAGAAWIEEQSRATRMVDVAYAAKPKGAYRRADGVVALGRGEVVALGDPNGTPPAGKIGYWSHGRAVSLVTLSGAGRRLVLQDLGGGMLRTNVFDALIGWTPPQGFPERLLEIPSEEDTPEEDEEEPEEIGPGQGVQGRVVSGGGVVLRFTGASARTYRRMAGRRVTVACFAAPATLLLGQGLSFGKPEITKVRVPDHGGTIHVRARAGRRDVCVVEMPGSGEDVAFATLSRAGRRYLGQFALLETFLSKSPDSMAVAGATSYPGAATIAAAQEGLVPMTTPGQRLPAGRAGVWTDGAQHALLAAAGPDGLRFVMADEGGGTVRTNAFGWLLGLAGSLA
jgi:hypothetical protein